MTAGAILIVVGGLLAVTAIALFLAHLWAQQQRMEERVFSLMSQLALLGKHASPPAPPIEAKPPVAVAVPAPPPPAPIRREPVERAPAAPAPVALESVPVKASPIVETSKSQAAMSPPRQQAPAFRNPGERDASAEAIVPGSQLPDFELLTVEGERFRRSQLTAKRNALVFLNPDDDGSKIVIEAIRSLISKRKQLPKLVYLIDGGTDQDAIGKWLGRLPKQVTALVQADHEVASVLRVDGTPTLLFCDERGMSQGRARRGSVAILEALGMSHSTLPAAARKANGVAPLPNTVQRSYRGLPDGALAPALTLPLLSGGDWNGASGPGRRRLVIFWSPDCSPCQRMLPDLAAASQNWRSFDAVLVTNGVGDENQALLDAGLAIPVALQEKHEAARLFQLLESPAAVRISPEGTIVGPPASGAQAIWSMVAAIEQASGGDA